MALKLFRNSNQAVPMQLDQCTRLLLCFSKDRVRLIVADQVHGITQRRAPVGIATLIGPGCELLGFPASQESHNGRTQNVIEVRTRLPSGNRRECSAYPRSLSSGTIDTLQISNPSTWSAKV